MTLGPIFGVLFDGFAYGMLLFLLSVGLSVTLDMMSLAHRALCHARRLCHRDVMNVYAWPFLATLPLARPHKGTARHWSATPSGSRSISA